MHGTAPDRGLQETTGSREPERAVLELTVRNHPGVMSHVCGLFARRAYNVEAILCLPRGRSNAAESRIWLLVEKDPRLPHMLRQIRKLVDVRDVRQEEAEADLFSRVEGLLGEGGR